MLRLTADLLAVATLTVLTQIGGFAWIAARLLTRRAGTLVFFAAFLTAYTGSVYAARAIAPTYGRVALPCADPGPGRIAALNPIYCVLNRIYASPELAAHLDALASHMEARFPGTRTHLLDAGFPFVDGFPLLPHVSHDDGDKADIAFFYDGPPSSPLGYFKFEAPRPGDPQPCANRQDRLTLRWDLDWLQPLFPVRALDETRTGAALRWLATNAPPGGRIFIEPHLAHRLGVSHPTIRFQGCRAARHDDHIHIQL